MLYNFKITFPSLSIRTYYFIFCTLSIIVGLTAFLLMKQNFYSDSLLCNCLSTNSTIDKDKIYPQPFLYLTKDNSQLSTSNYYKKDLFKANKNIHESQYNHILNVLIENDKSKSIVSIWIISFILFIITQCIIFYVFIIHPFLNFYNSIYQLYTKKNRKKNRKTSIYEFNNLISIIHNLTITQQDLYHKLQYAHIEKNCLQISNNIDYTTGLLNKKCINRYISRYIGYNSLCILMIDIDHFKTYNDTFGHIAGDRCLTFVAKCIKNSLKRKEDVVFRYGGEEFIVLLPNTITSGACIVADRIHDSLTTIVRSNITSIAYPLLTVSIGISEISPYKYIAPIKAIHQADNALYIAKHRGRNQTAIYSI